jgi:hypothetical protein
VDVEDADRASNSPAAEAMPDKASADAAAPVRAAV